MDPIVRPERSDDAAAIERVVHDAFGRTDEAALVAVLRRGPAWLPGLSLVAEVEGDLVGHVLFTRLHVGAARLPGLALAPVAVLPAWQRRGVGSVLVREGLRVAAARGEGFVIVLGHPDYYPRFGFRRAGDHGIGAAFEVDAAALMALELRPGGLSGVSGTIEWAAAFGLAT